MSSGYHNYGWHFEPLSTDGQKLVGTTGAEIELRQGAFIDMQLGSSFSIASGARIAGAGHTKVEHRETAITTITSATGRIPNSGVSLINPSTKWKTGGVHLFLTPPTTAGQKKTLVFASTVAMKIWANASSTGDRLSKKVSFTKGTAGSSMLILTLTSNANAEPGPAAKAELLSLSTGAWLIRDLSWNSSHADIGLCYTVSSTT